MIYQLVILALDILIGLISFKLAIDRDLLSQAGRNIAILILFIAIFNIFAIWGGII